MVNSPSPDHPPDALTVIRDRALSATDVSFVITDAKEPGTPIVWVNEAFTRTTGYPMRDVLGRNPSLLHGPDTDRAAAGRIGAAVRAGEPATVTVLNYRRDGTPFWNQVSVSPVPDDRGVITHWVGIQVDVTEQVRHAETQRRSIETERRARNGLALVSQVSEILADLDNPNVLRDIAGLLVPGVVRWSGFFLDDDGLQPADGITVTARPRPSRRLRAGTPAPAGPDDPVQLLLTGAVPGPLDVRMNGAPDGSTTARLMAALTPVPGELGTGGLVVHAVPGRQRVLGVLVTVPLAGGGLGELSDDDRAVLHLVVRRVGMAVDNVRLYAREHQLAETLQRAMLPEQAEVRDLDLWTYYAPSSGHAQVGGDWYDVLQASPDVVAVVVGDVVGHDVEAAAAMGQLRSVVRSYAFESDDPGTVIERVDQLITGMRVPRSASLVLAMLVRLAEGWSLRYSRAGHLPPLLLRGGEAHQLTGGAGTMIGFGAGRRTTAEVPLHPGDVLVLYTDGLIERRARNLKDGLARLAEVGSAVGAADAAGVGEELLSRLADSPEDDIAVVVVRIPDPAGDLAAGRAPRSRRWSLPSDPGSIGRARHAVLRTCATWGIPGSASAELVVSELVGNAVMHGWGHVVLRLFDTGEGLRIEVEDANPAPPVTTDGHHGRVGGYGMRIVERLADWGWRPSGEGKLVWARVHPHELESARDE